MGEQRSGEEDDSARGGRKITFFDGVSAPALSETGMMSPVVISPAITDALDLTPLRAGSSPTVLFREDARDGLSLVRARFGSDYPLPRHSHSSDCLYYIVSGQLLMGKRVLEAGTGFFVPAGRPYRFVAGPDGAEVLEFRHATSFDMVMRGEDLATWEQRVAVAEAHADGWAAPTG
jgi:mannose-6-phosphate isomerase-like protein (cupin superfamily)